MQRLMDDDAVDRRILHRQVQKIGLDKVERHRLIRQPGAGDAQHVRAAVERGDMARGRRENVRHPSRAGADVEQMRSEEPTSELQSLMRHSYAVFYSTTTSAHTITN